MLRTPLFPTFQGEGRRIIFSAAPAYHLFVRGTIGAGAAGVLYSLVAGPMGLPVPVFDGWLFGTSVMVAGAGFLALLSLEFIAFDTREKRYRRRYSTGSFGKISAGSLSLLDALVLTSHREGVGVLSSGQITYRLSLHWKGGTEPAMTLMTDTRTLAAGAPINSAQGSLAAVAKRIGAPLGLPIYDNTHILQPFS